MPKIALNPPPGYRSWDEVMGVCPNLNLWRLRGLWLVPSYAKLRASGRAVVSADMKIWEVPKGVRTLQAALDMLESSGHTPLGLEELQIYGPGAASVHALGCMLQMLSLPGDKTLDARFRSGRSHGSLYVEIQDGSGLLHQGSRLLVI